MIEITSPRVDSRTCDYCDDAAATHCIGVTEYENTCQECLAKMSQCAENGHHYQSMTRIMYSEVRAYKWLHCCKCWYDDLEPMYGVPEPKFRHQQVIVDGKNYLPLPPDDVF